MDPMAMTDDIADAMDSDSDANLSGSSSGSGCAPEPVPTQYEAFENVSPFSIFANLHADIHALVYHAVEMLTVILLPWWFALSYTIC